MADPASSAAAVAAAKAKLARWLKLVGTEAVADRGSGPMLLYLAIAPFVAVFLLVVFVVLWFTVLGDVLAGAQSPCGAGASASADDPIDLPALEIATRISLVGRDMDMGDREILAAYTVALVESGGGVTMVNVKGGDATSTGVFQQQDLPEWTQGANGEPRNRDNVSDAARTFFERLRHYDHGQPIGELAADIQRPREDLRYKYAVALPRARFFLTRVKAELGAGGGSDAALLEGLAPPGGCGATTGPANLGEAETLYQPRELVPIPSKYTGGARKLIDARILDDVEFIAERYDQSVIQGLGHGGTGSPSVSHNFGTAVDLAPAGSNAISEWRRTTEQLARDLGWTTGCGESGSRPACQLVPAIRFIGYNGFSDGNHGDPAHTGNPHIHISWECSCGPYDGVFHGLSNWVKSFPVASGGGARGPDTRQERREGAV